MLRGRIMSANGIKADDIKAQPNASWVLQSDRGITFATEVPRGSTVVEGSWWGAGLPTGRRWFRSRRRSPTASVSRSAIRSWSTCSAATSRPASPTCAPSNWENLGINFVLVFSPSAFAGAPHTDIATLTYPGGGTLAEETTLLKAVSDAFPAVTTVRVKDAIEAVGDIVRNLVLAVRGASMVALVAAMLVLGGALAAGHSYRVYDAVVLKTLGATRGKLIGAYALEYLLLGAATALFGVAAGSIAAWLVVTRVMNLTFAWLPGPAAGAAFGALLVTVALGLIGTFTALGHKPATVLRNL